MVTLLTTEMSDTWKMASEDDCLRTWRGWCGIRCFFTYWKGKKSSVPLFTNTMVQITLQKFLPLQLSDQLDDMLKVAGIRHPLRFSQRIFFILQLLSSVLNISDAVEETRIALGGNNIFHSHWATV